MKLSYTTLATPELNGVEAIRVARKIGYDGIDLRVSDFKGEVTLASSTQETCVIKDALKSEGITLSSLLCYNEYVGILKGNCNMAVDDIRRNIELACELGAGSIRISSGTKNNEIDFDSHFKVFCEVLLKVADKGTNGVNLLIQNHSNCFNALECADVIKAVNKPNLGLFFSADHSLLMGENISEILKAIKGITKSVFVADLIMKEDKYDPVLPGMGEVPVQQVYQSLGGNSFDGWFSFKWESIWHSELVGYEVALPHFIKYMHKLNDGLKEG